MVARPIDVPVRIIGGAQALAELQRIGVAGGNIGRQTAVMQQGLVRVGQAANQNLGNAGRQATALNNTFTRMNSTVVSLIRTFATFLAVRQVVQYADAWRNAENQLKLVTRSTDELQKVQSRLLQIANQTFTSFSATVLVYRRTQAAADELGLSSDQLLRVVETLNKTVATSGSTAAEAEGAMRQLTQGLARGQLRGQEFLSVAEQLPAVLQIVGEGLVRTGVASTGTAAEMQALAEQGKLTAANIIAALREMESEVDQRFGQINRTIGQSFQVLRNQLTAFIGGISEATNASSTIGDLIVGVANNLDALAVAIGAVAVAFVTRFVVAMATAVAATIAAGGAMATLLGFLTGPVGLILVVGGLAFALASKLLPGLRDVEDGVVDAGSQVERLTKFFGGLKDAVIDTAQRGFLEFERIAVGALANVTDFFSRAFANIPGLGGAAGTLGDITDQLRETYARLVVEIETLGNRAPPALNKVATATAEIGDSLDVTARKAKEYGEAQEDAIKILNNSEVATIANKAAVDEAAIAYSKYKNELDKLKQPSDLQIAALAQLRFEFLKAREELDKAQSGFSTFIEVLSNSNNEVDRARAAYLDAARELDFYRDNIDELNLTSQEQADLLAVMAANVEQLHRQYEIAASQAGQLRQRLQEIDEEIQLSTSLFEGARLGAEQFFLNLGTGAQNAANAMNAAFGTARDALADFFATGEFNAQSFFEALRRDAAEFFANQLLIMIRDAGAEFLGFLTTSESAHASTVANMTTTQQSFWTSVTELASGARDFITETIWPSIQGSAETLFDNLTTLVGGFWDFWTTEGGAGHDFILDVWDSVGSNLTDMIDNGKTIVGDFWDDFKELAGAAGTFLLNVLSDMGSGIASLFSQGRSLFDGLVSAIVGGIQALGSSGIANAIASGVSAIGSTVVSVATSAFNAVRSIFFADGGLVQALADGGAVQRFPGGGAVSGPGGPRDDRVPALLSNGEYVINARAVRMVGVPFLDAINDNHVRRFQTGGEIAQSPGFPGAALTTAAAGVISQSPGFPGAPLTDAQAALIQAEFERQQRIARGLEIFQNVIRIAGGLLGFGIGGLAASGIISFIRSAQDRFVQRLANDPVLLSSFANRAPAVVRGAVNDISALPGRVERDFSTIQTNALRIAGEGAEQIIVGGFQNLNDQYQGLAGNFVALGRSVGGRQFNGPFMSRAFGGPVRSGQLYETHGLGEREFFVPGSDGQIVTGNDNRLLDRRLARIERILLDSARSDRVVAENTTQLRRGGQSRALAGRAA